jgi:predicted ATPase
VAQKQFVRAPAEEGPGERWTLNVLIHDIELGIPETLQQMIERQLELLSNEEQELLWQASVAGLEFSTRTAYASNW